MGEKKESLSCLMCLVPVNYLVLILGGNLIPVFWVLPYFQGASEEGAEGQGRGRHWLLKSVAGEKGIKMFIYYQSGDELCLNPEVKSTIACLSPETTTIHSAELTTGAQDWETPYSYLLEDVVLCLGSC